MPLNPLRPPCSSPTPLPTRTHEVILCESFCFVRFICLFYVSDSTSKWKHTVFVFLWAVRLWRPHHSGLIPSMSLFHFLFSLCVLEKMTHLTLCLHCSHHHQPYIHLGIFYLLSVDSAVLWTQGWVSAHPSFLRIVLWPSISSQCNAAGGGGGSFLISHPGGSLRPVAAPFLAAFPSVSRLALNKGLLYGNWNWRWF